MKRNLNSMHVLDAVGSICHFVQSGGRILRPESKSSFKSPALSFLWCMQTSLPFDHNTSHNSCFAANAHFLKNWGCLSLNVLCYTSLIGTSSWAKFVPLYFQCPSIGTTKSHQDNILKMLLFLPVCSISQQKISYVISSYLWQDHSVQDISQQQPSRSTQIQTYYTLNPTLPLNTAILARLILWRNTYLCSVYFLLSQFTHTF